MKGKWNIVIALMAALTMMMATCVSVFADSVNSDDALNTALDNAGLKGSQVEFIEVDHDSKSNTYEVEFTKKTTGTEFEYEISGDTGKILGKSAECSYRDNSSHSKIGKTAAMKAVAEFSGISYETIKADTCAYDYDDSEGVYEIRFEKGNYRYGFEVLAPTGKVIEYEWELINR